MVKNSTIAPFNGVGALVAKFNDPITKKFSYKPATAFLISRTYILTAAHAIFKD